MELVKLNHQFMIYQTNNSFMERNQELFKTKDKDKWKIYLIGIIINPMIMLSNTKISKSSTKCVFIIMSKVTNRSKNIIRMRIIWLKSRRVMENSITHCQMISLYMDIDLGIPFIIFRPSTPIKNVVKNVYGFIGE